MDEEPIDYEKVVTAGMLWDMLEREQVPFACEDLGIAIPSADVQDKEAAASAIRCRKVKVLFPAIEVFSFIAAEIDAAVHIRIPPDVTAYEIAEILHLRAQWVEQSHDTILPACAAIITQLADRGYLEVTPKARAGKMHWARPVH